MDECQHEHVVQIRLEDERLTSPTRVAHYLKCLDCELITLDPSIGPDV